MYAGYLFAILTGVGQPVTMMLFGKFMGKGGESIGEPTEAELVAIRQAQFNQTLQVCCIMVGVGFFNWCTAFGF
jgi:hypothetical protein